MQVEDIPAVQMYPLFGFLENAIGYMMMPMYLLLFFALMICRVERIFKVAQSKQKLELWKCFLPIQTTIRVLLRHPFEMALSCIGKTTRWASGFTYTRKDCRIYSQSTSRGCSV